MKNKEFETNLDEKNLVVQSNSLIESSYTLSVSEQKIILAVVSMINPQDKDFKKYTFKISDFMSLAGIEDKSTYKRIRDLSKGLMEKVIQIRKPKSILYVNWFSSAEYFEGEGYVEIQISPKLKPYYLGLKEKFTQYQIKHVLQLKSFYSIRVYELLKQYEKLGERTFEVDELKVLLGISLNVYKLYTDFRKNVLLVAQKELCSKADISFTYKELKKGKKIEKIRFSIYKNEKQETDFSPNINDTVNVTLPESILNKIPYETRTKEVLKLVGKYIKNGASEDFLISNILYTAKRYETNFLKYLQESFKSDYAKNEREMAVKERELAEKQKKLLEEEAKIAIEREKLKEEKEAKEKERIYFIVSQLPEHDRKKIESMAAEDMRKFHFKPTITDADKITYTAIAYKKLGYDRSSNS